MGVVIAEGGARTQKSSSMETATWRTLVLTHSVFPFPPPKPSRIQRPPEYEHMFIYYLLKYFFIHGHEGAMLEYIHLNQNYRMKLIITPLVNIVNSTNHFVY